MSINRAKIVGRLKVLSCTSTTSYAGATGAPAMITLTASYPIGSISVESGPLFSDNNSDVHLVTNSVAGTYTGQVIITDIFSRQIIVSLTYVLTGSAALGVPTAFSASALDHRQIQCVFTASTGSPDGYFAVIYGNIGAPIDMGPGPSPLVFVVANPDTDYTVQIGAYKGPRNGPYTATSALTSIVTVHTDVFIDPGPDPGIVAAMADSFCTHHTLNINMNFNSGDSPYQYPEYITDHMIDLYNAGFRKVRVNPGPGTSGSATTTKGRLLLTQGWRFLGTMPHPISGSNTIAQAISRFPAGNVYGPWPDAFFAFEGDNEANSSKPAGWQAAMRAHQLEVFTRVNASSSYNTCPVYGPSIWKRLSDDITALVAAGGMSDRVDYNNLHWYTAGKRPSVGGNNGTDTPPGPQEGEAYLRDVMIDHQRLAPGKAVGITESGYMIFVPGQPGANAASDQYMTEPARSKYSQRALLNSILHGTVVGNHFALFDPDASRHHGMISHNLTQGAGGPVSSWVRRQVFDVFVRTFSMMKDEGPDFTPASLNYTMSGAAFDQDVQQKLYQKRTAANVFYWLAQYDSPFTWNQSTLAEDFRSKTFTFATPGQTMALVRRARPYASTTYTTVATSVNSFSAIVSDDLTIFEITMA